MIDRLLPFIARNRNGLWIGLAAFLLLVAAGWVGFLASDDVTYAWGAYGWLEEFPYVGGHGTIRYLITIPMALSFLLFGQNEVAMVLPSLLYVLGFMALAWSVTAEAGGRIAAFGALTALITSPLLVIQSSIAGVDVIELFFLFAAVVLFWRCLDRGPDARRLFLAGAMAGCAFLTRETAIFIVVFYALYFLKGHRFHRGHYLWIPAGFIAVWLLEVLYLWIMTGDPLYRITISLNHDSSIDRSVDLAGNLIVHPLIDPLLVLLLNQEFMLLFFCAVPAGLWLCFGKKHDRRLVHFCRTIALFGLVWFVCAGAAQSLLPLNPRYFMITAAMACMLTGIALSKLLLGESRNVRMLATLAALALIGTNLIGMIVENKDAVYGERMVARIAASMPQRTLITDPMTRYRADTLLRWEGAQSRVVATPPPAGSLYIHNPARSATPNFKMNVLALPAYAPGKDWVVIERFSPDAPFIARVLEVTGVSTRLPIGLWHKLRYRHLPVTLYRVGQPHPPTAG